MEIGIQIRLHRDFPSSVLWWIWCKIVFNYWPWINLNHPSTSVSSSPKWPAFYPFNLADVWTLNWRRARNVHVKRHNRVRTVGRSENLGGGGSSNVVGIICPPGWDEINTSVKIWGCHGTPGSDRPASRKHNYIPSI